MAPAPVVMGVVVDPVGLEVVIVADGKDVVGSTIVVASAPGRQALLRVCITRLGWGEHLLLDDGRVPDPVAVGTGADVMPSRLVNEMCVMQVVREAYLFRWTRHTFRA